MEEKEEVAVVLIRILKREREKSARVSPKLRNISVCFSYPPMGSGSLADVAVVTHLQHTPTNNHARL